MTPWTDYRLKVGFVMLWSIFCTDCGSSSRKFENPFDPKTACDASNVKYLQSVACGDTPANSCYSGTISDVLKKCGSVVTPLQKTLQFINGVWVESGSGNRVLASDGSDNWAYQLNTDGQSYSSSFLDKSHVVGRSCPSNTFVPGNLVALGKCLYYDGGNAAQRLDSAGTGQSILASLGLSTWDLASTGNGTGASWYEGNIKTCAVKGMRLPTLYETNASDPGGLYKPSDASPTFISANGVPSVAGSYTWTSSAYTAISNTYWFWSASSASGSTYTYGSAVRCVVP